MRVLISGAGIAGNALAFWLSKLGHDVTVVERFPDLRTTGLQIDLRGHGIEVLKRMGLEVAFRAKSAPEQGLQVVDKSGKRRAFFPANKSGKGQQNFTSEFEIMRGDLCSLLYDATKNGAKYIFGVSIQSLEQREDGVEVRFSDGKKDHFGLVVGADGQNSRTRRMIGTDGFFPLSGDHIAYFTIPKPIQEEEEYVATIYVAPGGRSIMTRRHSPDKIQVYLNLNSERFKKRGDVEARDLLADIFRGAGWQTEDILEGLKVTEDFYCEQLGLVKLDAWSRGKVTLVGDAAYCPSANTGMGTTCGIVGAYILAGEIGKNGDLSVALRAYEKKFRPFMDQVQKGVLEDSKSSMIPTTAFGIAIMNHIMGLASLFKVNIGKWIMKEDVKWEMPVYEELRL